LGGQLLAVAAPLVQPAHGHLLTGDGALGVGAKVDARISKQVGAEQVLVPGQGIDVVYAGARGYGEITHAGSADAEPSGKALKARTVGQRLGAGALYLRAHVGAQALQQGKAPVEGRGQGVPVGAQFRGHLDSRLSDQPLLGTQAKLHVEGQKHQQRDQRTDHRPSPQEADAQAARAVMREPGEWLIRLVAHPESSAALYAAYAFRDTATSDLARCHHRANQNRLPRVP